MTMNPTVASSGRFALILPALALVYGCATAPSPDLLSARAAYKRVEVTEAAKADPVALHKAKVALDAAEAAFAADPDGEATRDLAYVAERKALTAEAMGTTVITDRQKEAAELAFNNKQGQLLEGAKKDLAGSQAQLAEAGRVQDKTAADLNVERGARADADKKAAASEERATAANDALAKLAAKQEARGMVITLSGSVLFRSSQATLLPGAESRLGEVAKALVEAKERNVIVEGHTDSQGSNERNMGLSQRRAEAVRSYLISRGYPSDKIEARGVGEDRPVGENTSAEGRANNRRVEIVVQPAGHSSLR